MPPSERRAAIIEATLPLLFAHGASVTTRQIADAAGIAEGTIFRVFPDKDSVIIAAAESAFDPAPSSAAVAAIDRTLSLEAQLEATVEIIQQRVATVFHLMSILATIHDANRSLPAMPKKPPADYGEVEALFERHAGQLCRTPKSAAALLRGLTLAGTHPMFIDGEPMSPSEIVSLLLDGIRSPESTRSETPC